MNELSEIRNLVEEIHREMAGRPPSRMRSPVDTATRYAEACMQLNERIDVCLRMLSENRRLEALAAIEASPAITEAVELLTFDGWKTWAQNRNGLDGPALPELSMDKLRKLKGQYDELKARENHLQPLLEKYRLLAIDRAPLGPRITVLRQLVQAELDNGDWANDLATFERTRASEILREAKQAHELVRDETLDKLLEEIRDPRWVTKPSLEDIRKIETWKGNLEKKTARWRMSELAQQLVAAHESTDVTAAREVRAAWEECQRVARLPGDDPLSAKSSATLRWLDEIDNRESLRRQQDALERQQEEALAALEDAIHRPEATEEELESLYNRVLQTRAGIGDELQQKFENRLEQFAREAASKKTMRKLQIVVALLLILLAVWWGVDRWNHGNNVAQAAELLQKYVANDQFQQARGYLEQLESTVPEIARDGRIVSLAFELTRKETAEETRLVSFRAAIARADAGDIAHPDRQAVTEASALARTEDEQRLVRDLEVRFKAAADIALAQQTLAFRDKLAVLNGKLDSLASGDEGFREQKDAISATERELDLLDSEAARIGQLPKIEEARSRIVDLKQQVAILEQSARMKAGIGRSVGDHTSFESELRLYAQRFPTDPASGDFQTVLGDRDAWRAVDQWNAFAKEWNRSDRSLLSPLEARMLAEQVRKIEQDFTGFPCQAIVATRPFLDAIARREAPGQTPLVAALETDLTDPLIFGLYCIQARDGRQFLLKRVEHLPRGTALVHTFEYLVDFNLNTREGKLGKDDILFAGRAPQSQLATNVLTALSNLKSAGNWESTFHQILQEIEQQEQIDPVLKVTLLRKILGTACSGSNALALGYGKHSDSLNDLKFSLNVNWMDPTDGDAARARELARILLRSLPDSQQAAKSAAEYRQSFRSLRGVPEYQWIGWLTVDAQNNWSCAAEKPLAKTGRLVAVRAPLAGAKGWRIEAVGQLDQGTFRPRDPKTALVQGLPVYLEIEPSE